MDNFRALPKLNEKLEEMVSSGEARLATVVASYGNEVEVIVTGGARARFPSTHYDPPVGSSGALIATRGGGRLFTPMGVAIPIPFVGTASTRIQTTNITDFEWTGARSVYVQPGTYAAHGIAIMPIARNVASGSMTPAVRIGGAVREGPEVNAATNGWGPTSPYEFFTTSVAFALTFTTSDGHVFAEYGLKGGSTAGTTFGLRMQMFGTLTRTG